MKQHWRSQAQASLSAAVMALRVGMEARGSDSLAALIDALWSGLNCGDLQEISGRFLPLLEEILSAQERGDSIYVADLLEYKLAQMLDL
jgi:hypothetical protein